MSNMYISVYYNNSMNIGILFYNILYCGVGFAYVNLYIKQTLGCILPLATAKLLSNDQHQNHCNKMDRPLLQLHRTNRNERSTTQLLFQLILQLYMKMGQLFYKYLLLYHFCMHFMVRTTISHKSKRKYFILIT